MAVKRVHRAARWSRPSRAEDSLSLEQLNFRIWIHICDHVVKILEVPAADLSERGRKLLQGRRQELERVAKYHILSPLNLEIFLHVWTDHFNLAVRSLSKLVDDYMSIVATNVVEEYWDLETDWALQVTLAVRCDDKPARDVVVSRTLGPFALPFTNL